jgi:hypothetical protein
MYKNMHMQSPNIGVVVYNECVRSKNRKPIARNAEKDKCISKRADSTDHPMLRIPPGDNTTLRIQALKRTPKQQER